MAEETIYLCKFRVSVDGDWLCLRELSDVQFEVPPSLSNSMIEDDDRDPRTIERGNLLNVSKLIIKELIDSSMAHGRMLDDDHEPLQQFFVVLEHVLRHGLRSKKSILRDRRDFWCVLELVEKFAPEAAEITATVRDMPHLKTPLGKARAWLRLAAMQKSLSDYFKLLIEKREMVLTDFYEPGAFLMEDEGTVIAGLLVGLNVIDCNLGIKDEDLDQPMGVIDFSWYLKDTRLSDTDPDTDSAAMQEKMQTILDQKNYLEELNRHLNTTVANLQQKLEMCNTTNALMKEDLAIAKNTILELEDEKQNAESQRDTILHVHKHHIEKEDEGEVTQEQNERNEKPLSEELEAAMRSEHTESTEDIPQVVATVPEDTPQDVATVPENRPEDLTVVNKESPQETATIAETQPVHAASSPRDIIMPLISKFRSGSTGSSPKKSKESKKDIDVERQTYLQSRAGLDDMYAEVKKKLDEEIHLRLDVERELELQISMKQEIEMALQLLEKDIHEKQDSIIGLRKQLEDVKNINLQMYEKLETCDTSLRHKTEMVTKLEEKTNNLVSVLKDMEKKMKQTESEKNAAVETSRKLGQNLADRDAKRTALETDLRIEREWRGNLQKNLEQEKAKTSQLQKELQHYQTLESDHENLQRQFREMQKQCEEQEKTLAELGSHLSESKLRVEDMRELQMANKEASWASDKDVSSCKQCEKPFSVARRKHHCRNCGEIFCNECSDNKMPHPSSSKPVRVCDTCQQILLQRYSASGN
ncbi:RUN and FYVE domain-containing protein 2-like isoform X2 [Mercenaria mercenaria]|uniref:RUN and FYVE domain-containing protein 2-like isoform X2 n=1 Tax=Mercenaria mercenaria TaxID=6596 RepID=UPI00234FABB6|nr:RUN and FYVE domain-containing protein 2-like isoform X2 [Mercenaria mercenaria]XP_053392922.1 RUN and FYVE domain-containing protein 2-like isoform X2 [Mercenaria mercenaria]XP_053392923.1 RUN and FYVE domain-containing protein 2-like isoform X2 [Mercenaria mercenaria]